MNRIFEIVDPRGGRSTIPVTSNTDKRLLFNRYRDQAGVPKNVIFGKFKGREYYEVTKKYKTKHPVLKPFLTYEVGPELVTKSIVQPIPFSTYKTVQGPELTLGNITEPTTFEHITPISKVIKAIQKVIFTNLGIAGGDFTGRISQESILDQIEKGNRLNRVNNRNYPNKFEEYLALYESSNNAMRRHNNALEMLRDSMRPGYMYKIGFEDSDGDIIYMTITKNNIMKHLKNGQYLDGILTSSLNRKAHTKYDKYEEELSPDTIEKFFNSLVSVEEVPLLPHIGPETDGTFFPYLNTSFISLIRYQIIGKYEELDIVKQHCLIYTLEKLNIHKEHEISKVIKYGSFPKRNLTVIANIIGYNIKCHHFIKKDTIIKSAVYIANKNYKMISIALFKGHYFVFDKFRRTPLEGCVNSLTLIKKLFDEGKFVESPIFNSIPRYGNVTKSTILSEKHQDTYKILLHNQEACKNCTFNKSCGRCQEIYSSFISKKNTKAANRFYSKPLIVFADTESIISKNRTHIPFRHGFIIEGDTKTTISDTFTEHLHKIAQRVEDNQKVIIYYHNMKYDYSLIKNDKCITKHSICRKGGAYYSVDFVYMGKKEIKFSLRDSYKYIGYPLAEFATIFALKDSKKELIMYELYSKCNVKGDTIDIIEYDPMIKVQCVYDIKDGKLTKRQTEIASKEYYNYRIIDKSVAIHIAALNLINEQIPNETLIIPSEIGYKGKVIPQQYRHMRHLDYYLNYDCLVLRDGMLIFRRDLDSSLGVDSFKSLTISSIAHKYAESQGAYNNTYSVNNTTRSFITKAMAGGRVCTRNNIRHIAEGIIEDFDGVSLYPSAIARICGLTDNPESYAHKDGTPFGFPNGPFSVYEDHNHFLRQQNIYYFIEIISNQDTKEQPIAFPRVIEKDKQGSKVVYTNVIKGRTLYLGRYAFEDLVNFCGLKDYTFIRGIYWNNDTNLELGHASVTIFELRMQAKKEKNTAKSNILKLALNSLYGKNMLSRSNTSFVCKKNGKSVDKYIQKNYNDIIQYTVEGNTTVFKMDTTSIFEYNNIHLACMILDMSKRIMNEIIDLSQQEDIKILYTDTDSMHVVNNNKDIERLSEAYLKKYSRVLIGPNLTQFHTDFEYKDHHEVYAIKSYIVDKKVYLDILRGVNNETKEVEYTTHIRYKGIGSKALQEQVEIYGSEEDVYKKLITGTEMIFNLCYGDAISFDTSGINVKSRVEFYRKALFVGKEIELHRDVSGFVI